MLGLPLKEWTTFFLSQENGCTVVWYVCTKQQNIKEISETLLQNIRFRLKQIGPHFQEF